MSARMDRSPLSMQIIELNSVPLSRKVLQLPHACYMRVTVETYKPRTVPPVLTVSAILSGSCQLPASTCLWLLRWTALFVGECEARFEPNFVPTCALCKIGEYTAKLGGCPFFQDLMEKESRLSRNKSSQIRQRTSPGHNEPDNVNTARPPETYSPQIATFSLDRLPTASPSIQCEQCMDPATKN